MKGILHPQYRMWRGDLAFAGKHILGQCKISSSLRDLLSEVDIAN
jgi:hypothetical protein